MAGALALLWVPSGAVAGELAAALDALRGGDLVLLEDGKKPGGPARVMVAARVRAREAAVRAVLVDPAAYRQAIPALVRSDVIESRDGSKLVAWELEIPLFNLKGKMRVRAEATGVAIDLVDGDLAPGELRFTLTPEPGAAQTLLALEGHANLRGANWLFRRLIARTPLAEPAMMATAAWVLLRAAGARAEHPDDTGARRPQGPPVPPAAAALDARQLADPALAPFRARGTLAAVEWAAGRRFAAAHVAVASAMPPDRLTPLLARPETWRALPGWRRVSTLPAAGPEPSRVKVDADMPLTDFDATWELAAAPGGMPLRATAVGGATQGAVLAWDLVPVVRHSAGKGRAASLALYSTNPLLAATGFVPRKFIAAEPFLEHGMSLALAYVNARSVIDALAEPKSPPPGSRTK